ASVAVSQDLTAKQWLDSGYVAYQQGFYEEAIDKFQQSIDIDNQNPETYYLKGVCQSQINLNLAAIKSYEKALSLDPEYAEVHFEKGYSYFSLNQFQNAIQAFDKAIDYRPNYAEAWFNRGSVKCIIGEKEAAMDDWARAKALGASIPNLDCE
ncbi:tetratricopeptide repeat protein, partial [Fulvivirga sp. RKSG066]|uniref:tetratricopeptide repeat protein n=1 Tax=Fulvivirga aurantia TaxID=2529383 RepID=UPI0012BC6399